jgi:endonuclease/exonuclease/phosphatase family metal-dependent hydrolase
VNYKTIHLITTNDLHGQIVGQKATFMNPEYPPDILDASAMYKYIKDLRIEAESKHEGVLLLDGGNFFQGHPFGIADSGKTMIEWMNKLKYDALVPGSYDFIGGTENIKSLAESANFPFLIANLENSDFSARIKPYTIVNTSGIQVGILGIVPYKLDETVLEQNRQGISILSEIKTMNYWIPIMKEEGAKVIIVLTSLGIPWDREEVYSDFIDSLKVGATSEFEINNVLELGYFSDEVDFIVSGGVSKGYPDIWYDPHSHVFITQNYGNGTEFGHIQLHIDPDFHNFIGYKSAVDGRVGQTMLSDDFIPEPDMSGWIQEKAATAIDFVYSIPEWNTTYEISTQCDSQVSGGGKTKVPNLNLSDEIEIITWNTEFFPAHKDSTLPILANVISDLNVDMIAFQEIRFTGYFSGLMNLLPEYDFIVSQQSSFMDQAIIYKRKMFTLLKQTELFAEDDYNFAGRPPLRGDFQYKCGDDLLNFSVINLHMKCCDSGLKRRQNAVRMLHNFISNEMNTGYKNFIVLGDWNDDLKDKENEHCFHPFKNDDRFYFVNESLVYDESKATYPKEPYVSYLDHILVTKQMIPKSDTNRIETLFIENYIGGFSKYERYISDHRPVLLGFAPFK